MTTMYDGTASAQTSATVRKNFETNGNRNDNQLEYDSILAVLYNITGAGNDDNNSSKWWETGDTEGETKVGMIDESRG